MHKYTRVPASVKGRDLNCFIQFSCREKREKEKGQRRGCCGENPANVGNESVPV